MLARVVVAAVTVMYCAVAWEGRHLRRLRSTIFWLLESFGFAHTNLCRIQTIYEKSCSLRLPVTNHSQGMASVHTDKYLAA